MNSNATKVNSYTYDPYGVQLSANQQIANPWRYASGYYDGSTGLTRFGARYSSPDLGRFTQRDPSDQDLPYTYAGCDPVNNTDPAGLKTGNKYVDGCMEVGMGAGIAALVGTGIAAAVTGGVTAPAVIATFPVGFIKGCLGKVVEVGMGDL